MVECFSPAQIMHDILPNLYLSGFHGVPRDFADGNFFVVNCTKDLPMLSERGIRVAVNDDGNMESMDDMYRAMLTIPDVIHAEMSQGIPVVVHCLAGQQRSPAIVCAYLMRYRGWTMVEAIQWIREKKKDAFFWKVNFQEPLERLAAIQ